MKARQDLNFGIVGTPCQKSSLVCMRGFAIPYSIEEEMAGRPTLLSEKKVDQKRKTSLDHFPITGQTC